VEEEDGRIWQMSVLCRCWVIGLTQSRRKGIPLLFFENREQQNNFLKANKKRKALFGSKITCMIRFR